MHNGNVLSWLPEDIQDKFNIKGLKINSLLLGSQLWITWHKGYFKNIIGKINAEEIGLVKNSIPDASNKASNKARKKIKKTFIPPFRKVSVLYSVAPLKPESFNHGFEIALTDLAFEWDDYVWNKSDFLVDVDLPSKIDPLQFTLNASEVDLQPIAKFLVATNSLPKRLKETVEKDGIPERYRGLWPLYKDKQGNMVFFNTKSLNFFDVIKDFVELNFTSALSPIFKLPYEQISGKSSFTGKDFTTPAIEMDPSKEDQKVRPDIISHMLRQFPQFKMLEDIITPGKKYDTGNIFEPKPIKDTETGEMKYPVKVIENILNYFGFKYKSIDMENSVENYLKKKAGVESKQFKEGQVNEETMVSIDEMTGTIKEIIKDPEFKEEFKKLKKITKEQENKDKKERREKYIKAKGKK